jgi:sigma-B regulation protein RsbU (phosphoserine phosphatase)
MSRSTILLVDDESLVREELGGMLEDDGYRVITASDGEEGLTVFRTARPDMVITDARMPRRDGLSLAAAIRGHDVRVPITVITGHGSEAMLLDALRVGVTDFVRKPVRVEDLSAALLRMNEVLAIARRIDQKVPGSVRPVEQSWVFETDNDPAGIPAFVEYFVATCAYGADFRSATELSLALRELILNAIEHGNLGVTSEEKRRAIEARRLTELIHQRLADPALAARRATITARRRHHRIDVEIRDQGDGFDWNCLPDPRDPANLLREHGRGVLLARVSVDDLAYRDRGTCVTFSKLLRTPD